MKSVSPKRPKVLMLGWEYPPFIVGGLGVATEGIARTLAAYADVTLVLPYAQAGHPIPGLEIISLKDLALDQLTEESWEDVSFEQDIHFLQEVVEVYQTAEQTLHSTRIHHIKREKKSDLVTNQSYLFQTEDLYGGDLGTRVQYYGKIVRALTSTRNFDLVHAHDWMTFSAGMMVKEARNIPLVLHVHSTEIDRNGPESRGWVYHLEKSAFEMADAIVPVSFFTSKLIQKYYEIEEAKIQAIHNGIDQIKSYRSESNLPEKVVLFLGRITGQKGPDFFFQTASKVLEIMPNVRFVMAGSGNMMKGLIEMGAYKNIGNRFHFTGFLNQEKVRYLFSIADVYVMPSVSEPFGLSALEAAQFGIPCVISYQSGVSEVLQGALKADYWDTDKMSSNIISILKYKGLRDQLIKDAYHDLSKLTWEETSRNLAKLYTQVLSTQVVSTKELS